GKAFFQMYPAPNASGAGYNYVSNPNRTQFSHVFDVRLDHHFSEGDRDTLFGRYSYNHVDTGTPGPFPETIIQTAAGAQTVAPVGTSFSFPGSSQQRIQQVGLTYVHVFRPDLLLELKTGFLRFVNKALPVNGEGAATRLGFPCNVMSCVNSDDGGAAL